ncbi:MAG TPA: zinc dependent phospholipase C family protein, partial [Anaerolineae bacterium]|nr:zinc dependent phospholipase C family protein [Anaerolineae bacterium]
MMKRKVFHGALGRRFPAARLALCVILVTVTTGGLTTASSACGGAIHHEIVDMAWGALDKPAYPGLATLLANYHPATEAGAVFPDFGYGMPFDQEYWAHLANDAHSPEFQRAYLETVRGIFRQPGNEDHLRTITFLFGVIGHNEADNPWHFDSGGVQSFLNAAMHIDENDHTSVEVGTDVFANVEYGQGGHSDSWWTPLGAVRAAYLAIGHDVPEYQLEQGMLLLASAHTAIKAIGYPTYLAYLIDLSWSHNNLVSYPLGGMQDGAYHTALAWQAAWDELSTYRTFLPAIYRDSAGSPGVRSQDGANPNASAGQQALDGLRRRADAESMAPLMLLAQELLDEGV